MHLLQLLALWTAVSIPVSLVTGRILAASQPASDPSLTRVPLRG